MTRNLGAKKAASASIAILIAGWIFWVFLSDHSQVAYPRVDYWIQAAKCAAQTGRYLVVCETNPDGSTKEIPVEDVSLADDRGHTLILSFLADVGGILPTLDVLRTVNLTIGFLGLLALSLALVFQGFYRGAVFSALVGAYWLGARAGPDVDAAYIGIAALSGTALILAATLKIEFTRPSLLKSIKSFAAVFFLLAFTVLIREPIGLGAALSLIALSFVLWCSERSLKSAVKNSVLIVIAVLSLKTASAPTAIRDFVVETKPTGISAHGLSHNLFLGLGGFVENKWGIVWDDAYAENLMKQLYPDIAYCSDAYFKAIGELYWSYVKSDPPEAARIYSVKTGRTLSAAEGLSWSALVSLLLISITAVVGWRHGLFREKNSVEKSMVLLGPALFAMSFIGQGILTHPAWTYVYPGPVLLMVVVAIFLEMYLQHRSQSK